MKNCLNTEKNNVKKMESEIENKTLERINKRKENKRKIKKLILNLPIS